MAAGWRDEEQQMTATKIFSHAGEGAWTPTSDGNRRRVLVHTRELMMVEFGFDKGGVGALHSHPHVQASYVAEGRFEVTVDGRSEILETGSSFIVPSNLLHGVKALEAGRLSTVLRHTAPISSTDLL
jgi:unsaturated pyranuronate lyase